MRIGVSGTYSSGKTTTALTLSHLTGIPRTDAATMRELFPHAAPGKTLAQCTSAEYVQLVVRRHVERAVHEALLGEDFVSDGCSLQEWSYGTARVAFGMNPTEDDRQIRQDGESAEERRYFGEVFQQLGIAFRQHVAASFDAFIYLRHELGISDDGHRPMNEAFRTRADDMLRENLALVGIPVHEVSGSVRDRVRTIVDMLGLEPVTDLDSAIARADADYAELDLRLELERQKATSAAG